MPNLRRRGLLWRVTCRRTGKVSHTCHFWPKVLMISFRKKRRTNIYFNITSPAPGTFIIALHFKGRDKPILEMDLKIDDLLEKQKDHQAMLDLEYVQLNVPKVLALFNKVNHFVYAAILVMGLTVGCSCSRRGDKDEKPARDEWDRRIRSVHIILL